MSLKNTSEKYGSVTKFLHWAIFLLFVTQYFLVYRREYFPKNSPEKLQYILLHVSIGVVVLIMALFMITWRYANSRPLMPTSMSYFEIISAKLVHYSLYAMMVVQPISGIVMSQLSGHHVNFFGWFDLPTLFAQNKYLGKLIFDIHVWGSYLIIGLVSIHVLAALFHHFVRRDSVLKRMLPFN